MRLIDGDKLQEFPIRANRCDKEHANTHFINGIESVMEYAEMLPTVDAEVVVRCKDCKHLCVWNRKDIYAFCPKTNIVFLPFELDTRTFFCSLGERKDGGTE